MREWYFFAIIPMIYKNELRNSYLNTEQSCNKNFTKSEQLLKQQ